MLTMMLTIGTWSDQVSQSSAWKYLFFFINSAVQLQLDDEIRGVYNSDHSFCDSRLYGNFNSYWYVAVEACQTIGQQLVKGRVQRKNCSKCGERQPIRFWSQSISNSMFWMTNLNKHLLYIFFQIPIFLYTVTAQYKGPFRLTIKWNLIQMQWHLEAFQAI